jgi:hypothetical protein
MDYTGVGGKIRVCNATTVPLACALAQQRSDIHSICHSEHGTGQGRYPLFMGVNQDEALAALRMTYKCSFG